MVAVLVIVRLARPAAAAAGLGGRRRGFGLGLLAQLAEVAPRVKAAVVAVLPHRLQGVAADNAPGTQEKTFGAVQHGRAGVVAHQINGLAAATRTGAMLSEELEAQVGLAAIGPRHGKLLANHLHVYRRRQVRSCRSRGGGGCSGQRGGRGRGRGGSLGHATRMRLPGMMVKQRVGGGLSGTQLRGLQGGAAGVQVPEACRRGQTECRRQKHTSCSST